MPHLSQRFDHNVDGRDFVVGDLHGCYDMFQAELNKVNFDFEIDRMFSVGDLIDRGTQNIECLDLLHQPWFHAVKGNHEDMFYNCFMHGEENIYLVNGGQWTNSQDHAHMIMWALEQMF